MSNEYNNGLKDGYDDGIEESEMGILTKEEIRKMIEEEGLVEDFIDLGVQLQPVGIDLTTKQICVFRRTPIGVIDFDNSKRTLPKTKAIGFGLLEPGIYLLNLNEKVNLPNNIYAFGLPRSSLLRCGAGILSAVWDPGYCGHGQVMLEVNRRICIKKNAKVFQLKFYRCKKTEKYSGIYNETKPDMTSWDNPGSVYLKEKK